MGKKRDLYSSQENDGHFNRTKSVHDMKECTIDTLQACSFCSRRFIPASLEKHEKICQRTFIDKRRVFNSQKQRITDPGKNSPGSKSQEDNETKATYLKSRWREKHADLISTVRAARGIAVAEKNGKPIPPVPRSLIPSDYTMCEFCHRHFSIKAAERHIEWCKEQKSRIGQTPKVSLQARERLEARTKYKAPALRRKNAPNKTVKKATPKSTKALSEKDCKDPFGKPPTHGSSINRNYESNDQIGGMNVRVRGVSVSPPQKPSSRDSEYDNMHSRRFEFGEGPTRKYNQHAVGGLISQNASRNDTLIQGRNIQPIKHRNGREVYNPYVAAEQQMRDLLEGSSEASRGQPRSMKGRDGRGQSHNLGGVSNAMSVAHEIAMRDTRHQPLVRRTTIQVRDKDARLALADQSNKRASGQSAYAYSDSDEESLTPYSERGSGDLRATYTLVSSDKVNRNGSTNSRLRNSNGPFGSRNSVASVESDSSSNTRRRNTPSPPLKLPSANTVKTSSHSSSSRSSNLWQPGRSTARACDNERLSTSSSDSSLPPLNNNNNTTNKSRSRASNHNREARTACFCHECGTSYPVASAKFCCECGTRRLLLI